MKRWGITKHRKHSETTAPRNAEIDSIVADIIKEFGTANSEPASLLPTNHGNTNNCPEEQSADIIQGVSVAPGFDTFTDSGYGSNGLAKTAPGCLETIEEEVQERPLENELKNKLSPLLSSINSHTETQEYAGTVYSDTESLQNPKFSEYAVAFADQLSNCLSADFLRNDIENISPQLPPLLRSFASRIAHEIPVNSTRPIKHLVDKYRLYIFPSPVVSTFTNASITKSNFGTC